MIGDDIKVMVVRSDRGDLRLAVCAPEHVKITRGEIYELGEGTTLPKADP